MKKLIFTHTQNPTIWLAWLAWLAAWAAVAIGAGWQLATRHSVSSNLAPIDLALLRYTVPAIILAPVWWRLGLLPAPHVSARRLALIVAGAGLPFGLLAMWGASFAPAAHMGVLIPGFAPVLTLAGSAMLGLGRLTTTRMAGAAVTFCGLLLVVFPVFTAYTPQLIVGDLLFIAAAVVWTMYTLAFKGSNLQPLHAVSMISAYSALLVVPLWLVLNFAGRTRLLQAPLQDIALQFLMQGVLTGVVGLYVTNFAIQGIGATRAAAVGALVPVIVALGAGLFLNEALTVFILLGSAFTSTGVWLMARAPRSR